MLTVTALRIGNVVECLVRSRDVQADANTDRQCSRHRGLVGALRACCAAAAAALAKPKPKRINYRKNEYYYQIKKDGTGKPLGYLLFNTTDLELSRPVGYVEANPATGLPKGPVVEPPKD